LFTEGCDSRSRYDMYFQVFLLKRIFLKQLDLITRVLKDQVGTKRYQGDDCIGCNVLNLREVVGFVVSVFVSLMNSMSIQQTPYTMSHVCYNGAEHLGS
jgi:hypothetical protein